MTARIRKNDIPISKSRWIVFRDLEGRHADAAEVDELLIDLLPLWQALELHCVAGCCGFDAFDFYPEAIAFAANGLAPMNLRETLDKSIDAIEAIDITVVASTRLNNLADKQTFIELLSHVKSCIPTA